MDTTALIYARLAQSVVATSLATFDAQPAIFSDRTPDAFIFEAAAGPAVIIAAPNGDDGDDTFTSSRRAVRQDIRIYHYDDGSAADLDTAARAVRALFHNQEPALTALAGHPVILSTASGPVGAPSTDAAVIGRRISLSLLIGDAP